MPKKSKSSKNNIKSITCAAKVTPIKATLESVIANPTILKKPKDLRLPTIGTTFIRAAYPKGSRVVLVQMDDIQAPPLGTQGTVQGVNDIGTIMVHWDNGSHLGVVLRHLPQNTGLTRSII